MRIAGIARQCCFAPDEVIYRAQDPAESMYCVAQGAVRLVGNDGRAQQIEERGTFGVAEILSDRLRQENASATDNTLALAIDTEDFFELLSNNIEIVKALFRQMLRPSTLDESPKEADHGVLLAQ